MCPRGRDALGQLGVGRGVLRGEASRVGLVGQPSAHHVSALRRVTGGGDLDRQPEAVEQLRAELAFLGIHRADQQEARGVPHRHALAFDVRRAERRRVEQEVDKMVVQQVHLVDVEHSAVSAGEQSRFVRRNTGRERFLQVQRADQPVLARPDGELHQTGRAQLSGRPVVRAVWATRIGIDRVAGEAAARDHSDRGQQRGQGADDGGLGGPLLPPHEHTTDCR